MVLKPEPIFDTVERVEPPRPLLYLSPAGRVLTQAYAAELASLGGFSLLCGRYEGVDERVREHLVDGEISIGDYVLAGGEVAAAVILEAVCRLVPGMVGNQGSVEDDSFSEGLLEYPHYTRPASYRGWDVPEVLRVGRPRPGGPLAAGPGPGPNGPAPSRPAGGPGRPVAGRRRPPGRVRSPTLISSSDGWATSHLSGGSRAVSP